MLNYTTKKKSDDDPRAGYSVLNLAEIATGAQTGKAIQVSINGQTKWLAKSKITDLGNGKFKIPNWMLADANGAVTTVKPANQLPPVQIPQPQPQPQPPAQSQYEEFSVRETLHISRFLKQINEECELISRTLKDVLYAIVTTNEHLLDLVSEMKSKEKKPEVKPTPAEESIIKAIEADIKESQKANGKDKK